jgi:hypothetical protein
MAKGERSCRVCPAPDRAVQALTFCRQVRFDVVDGPWLARRDRWRRLWDLQAEALAAATVS